MAAVVCGCVWRGGDGWWGKKAFVEGQRWLRGLRNGGRECGGDVRALECGWRFNLRMAIVSWSGVWGLQLLRELLEIGGDLEREFRVG